jgi:hypothetical protein
MNSTVQKINSLVPLASNIIQSNVKSLNTAANQAYLGLNKALNTGFTNAAAAGQSALTNSGAASSTFGSPLMWFVGFLLLFFVLFAFYYRQFMDSLDNLNDTFQKLFNNSPPPSDPPSTVESVAPPVAPQDEGATPPSAIESVVEKILPPAKEVFNISKNDFTYYDAAPLCKALGAELATYDQVKESWQKGSDWCNYGWVKGQMAVYPTQKSTYEELQTGPAEQRGACGKPGLNGGYFDNPELKFGVTCYGSKPPQSQHDSTTITSGSTKPLTSSGIEFEKKVQHFKEQSESLGILPFNNEKWQST